MNRPAPIDPASVPFAIPAKGDAEFEALPGHVRHHVRLWAQRLARVWSVRPITAQLARLARKHRIGYSTVLRYYYELLATGDWRVLVDRRHLPTMPVTGRVFVPPGGLRVRVISRGKFEAIISIERLSKVAERGGKEA